MTLWLGIISKNLQSVLRALFILLGFLTYKESRHRETPALIWHARDQFMAYNER